MGDEISIVIADDHPVVRKGLRNEIEAEPDLKVVGEAGDGAAALALLETLRPRIAVLDLHMPKMDGFRVAELAIKRELGAGIIFLTMHDEVDLLQEAMKLGKGYILKESALAEVVNGIRRVAAGRTYVSPSMADALFERRSAVQTLHRSLPGLDDLTAAERRILKMIGAGKATKEIAAELHVHPRTVESHRAGIGKKLQLNGANSLLRFALEHKAELLD